MVSGLFGVDLGFIYTMFLKVIQLFSYSGLRRNPQKRREARKSREAENHRSKEAEKQGKAEQQTSKTHKKVENTFR